MNSLLLFRTGIYLYSVHTFYDVKINNGESFDLGSQGHLVWNAKVKTSLWMVFLKMVNLYKLFNTYILEYMLLKTYIFHLSHSEKPDISCFVKACEKKQRIKELDFVF